MILIYILLIILNIPTELEGPITLVADDFSLPVYSINNFVERLNGVSTRDVSYNKGTTTCFRNTESSNKDDSLLITALNNH